MTEDKEILDALHEEGKQDYAFSLLVRKYSERLYWHIRKIVFDHDDADDLLQNTLIKAWKNLPGFREESRLYTWLYKIATNEALNFLKSRRVKSFLSLKGYEKAIEDRFTTSQYFNGDEITRRLYRAMEKLPPRQKAVFIMRYFEEMKMDEIAEIIGRSTGAVKATYHHAFLKMKNFLSEDD